MGKQYRELVVGHCGKPRAGQSLFKLGEVLQLPVEWAGMSLQICAQEFLSSSASAFLESMLRLIKCRLCSSRKGVGFRQVHKAVIEDQRTCRENTSIHSGNIEVFCLFEARQRLQLARSRALLIDTFRDHQPRISRKNQRLQAVM